MIIVDSQAIIRNNTEIPCALYPISPNGDILQNYIVQYHIFLEIFIPRKRKKETALALFQTFCMADTSPFLGKILQRWLFSLHFNKAFPQDRFFFKS